MTEEIWGAKEEERYYRNAFIDKEWLDPGNDELRKKTRNEVPTANYSSFVTYYLHCKKKTFEKQQPMSVFILVNQNSSRMLRFTTSHFPSKSRSLSRKPRVKVKRLFLSIKTLEEMFMVQFFPILHLYFDFLLSALGKIQ